MSKNIKKIREEFLKESINEVPFHGWTEEMMWAVETKLDLKKNYHSILFPSGLKEVVTLFENELNDYVTHECSNKFNNKKMRVRDKVKEAVIMRIKGKHENSKLILSKIVTFYSKFNNINLAIKNLWKIVDNIWYLCGDEATDFNHYTKRMILFTIYKSSLLYYVSKKNISDKELEAFVEKNIENSMKIVKIKQIPKKIISIKNKIPFLRLFK